MLGLGSGLWGLWRRVVGRGSGEKEEPAAKPGEVVLFIIGPTGSGKSTLINEIIGDGKEWAVVGHGLSTCTEEVKGFAFDLPADAPRFPGKRLLLVDTPGFDDTAMNDSTRVFDGVSKWVADYPKSNPGSPKPQVVGFVYLQDITQKRVNNRQNVDFQRLQKLAERGGGAAAEGNGKAAASPYANLVLATFQWPKNKESVGYKQALEREKELEGKFWKDLIGLGARMVRVEDVRRDARKVVWEALAKCSVEFPSD